jgi:hypothetical protein
LSYLTSSHTHQRALRHEPAPTSSFRTPFSTEADKRAWARKAHKTPHERWVASTPPLTLRLSPSQSVGALPFPPPGAPLPPPPPGSMALANVQRMRWTQMVLAAGGLTAGTWYAAAYARKLLASSSSATAAAVAAIVEPTSSRCVMHASHRRERGRERERTWARTRDGKAPMAAR